MNPTTTCTVGVLEGDELIMTHYRKRSACHSFSSQSSIWETVGPFVAQELRTPSQFYQRWLTGGRHNVMGYSCSFGWLQISMKQQRERKKKKKLKKGRSWDKQCVLPNATCNVQCASTAHLMFLYLHAQTGKAGRFIRALEKTCSPSAEEPTKLPCTVRARWNFKC